MTVTCVACQTGREAENVGSLVCDCGGRCFEWRTGADKPQTTNYDRSAWAWGARTSEAA